MYAIVLLHVVVMLLAVGLGFIGLSLDKPKEVIAVMLTAIGLLLLDGFSLILALTTFWGPSWHS